MSGTVLSFPQSQSIASKGPTFAAKIDVTEKNLNIQAPEVNLRQARFGHNGGRAMADITREEIKAQIDASEARTEIKIVRLESKIDLVLSKLDSAKADNSIIRTNQWVIAFGLALLIVAVVTLFPVFFGIGAQVRDMVDSSVQSHLQKSDSPPKN